MIVPSDPHHLDRFLDAQKPDYAIALAELIAGRKRSHWMWYIFPQYAGLGYSPTSKRYAIKCMDEARAYLTHPILGPRLHECADAVMKIEGRTAHEIFGAPDDAKLKSCATLFALVSEPGSVFDRLLGKYFQGTRDEKTLKLIGLRPGLD
ncbi:MAG: DUF1810 domain-containing protein [Pseudomonadota bacterium]